MKITESKLRNLIRVALKESVTVNEDLNTQVLRTDQLAKIAKHLHDSGAINNIIDVQSFLRDKAKINVSKEDALKIKSLATRGGALRQESLTDPNRNKPSSQTAINYKALQQKQQNQNRFNQNLKVMGPKQLKDLMKRDPELAKLPLEDMDKRVAYLSKKYMGKSIPYSFLFFSPEGQEATGKELSHRANLNRESVDIQQSVKVPDDISSFSVGDMVRVVSNENTKVGNVRVSQENNGGKIVGLNLSFSDGQKGIIWFDSKTGKSTHPEYKSLRIVKNAPTVESQGQESNQTTDLEYVRDRLNDYAALITVPVDITVKPEPNPALATIRVMMTTKNKSKNYSHRDFLVNVKACKQQLEAIHPYGQINAKFGPLFKILIACHPENL